MNRFRTATRLAICAAMLSTTLAHAQQDRRGNRDGGNRDNGGGRNDNNRGGTLPLPQGVRRVIAIDAQNTLLAEMEPQSPGGPSEYRAIKVQHVYVGGIARLFGGEVIPTEDFVTPGFSRSNNTAQDSVNGQRFRGLDNGNNQNNGFNGSGQNNYGQNGYNNGYNGFGSGFGAPVPGGYLVPNGVTTYITPDGVTTTTGPFVAPNTIPNSLQQPTTGVFYNGRRVFQRNARSR